MKTFYEFLLEKQISGAGLHVFDIDSTLFHTSAKVNLDGGNPDFSEFRSAEKFANESRPNERMLTKMRTLHDKAKKTGGKVIINTARADFDDRDKFLDTFRKHNVDIDNIHVHRAGNITSGSVGEKKASIIRNHLNTGKYSHASLYDDSEENLNHFLELKKEFPHIHFNAQHVKPNGNSKRYHR